MSSDARLEEALAEYEVAREEGRALDRAAFLARHPDLADDLANFLDAGATVDDLTRPLREALDGRPPLGVPVLEGYEILEEVGRGGMGVVYKARQNGTEQIVALKMLNPGWLGRLDETSREEAIELLRVEARAAARLRHPSTIQILHMGEHEGRPFYAMQFVEGVSLAGRLRDHPAGHLSNLDAARHLAEAAEAVHEAHQHGVLHRDLKPHNLLLDERGHRTRVADFGLAKVVIGQAQQAARPEQSVRQHRTLLGTLPYMPPEQALDPEAVTVASDVYSLGATLYECLTGQKPLAGETHSEVLRKIGADRPAPPRKLNPGVHPRLEAICLRCLEKDPGRRYPSAQALAQALRGYLDEVGAAVKFSTMGSLMAALGPVTFLINAAVHSLLQGPYSEPVVWLCVFSMYPAMFSVFLLAPRSGAEVNALMSRQEMWSLWGAKLFTAAAVASVLRVALDPDSTRAVLLSYPVFASLSGMVVFVMARILWRMLYVLAFLGWLVALAMLLRLEWAPLVYGLYAGSGCVVFGFYLRKMGREMS